MGPLTEAMTEKPLFVYVADPSARCSGDNVAFVIRCANTGVFGKFAVVFRFFEETLHASYPAYAERRAATRQASTFLPLLFPFFDCS